MGRNIGISSIGIAIIACGLSMFHPAVMADDQPASAASTSGKAQKSKKAPAPDYSGKTRKGKASYYSKSLAGETMADGTPMNPQANIAASRTLPLGTKAKVTNLENGKSAEVEIRDRGPYVEGRITDVSPSVAKKLDMTKDGVVPVTVTPTELPQREDKQAPAQQKATAAAQDKRN